MSRPAGQARAALLDALKSGAHGSYKTLAGLTGLQPETARAALKELSRDGKARAGDSGRRSRSCPAVYAAHEPTFDALGYMRQVWR